MYMRINCFLARETIELILTIVVVEISLRYYCNNVVMLSSPIVSLCAVIKNDLTYYLFKYR